MSFDFLSLKPATRFIHAFTDDFYQEVPDDWWVIVTDVVSSTRAIEAGRYKDINMLGAACITAVFNTVGGAIIPFVFGGDGASFLCSSQDRDALIDELLAVRSFGLDFYDLELRVGCVPLSEIRREGKNIQVARLELSPGNNLALFNGGGLALADTIIKADQTGEFCKQNIETRLPNLEGLSCRWQPLKPVNGQIITLLVHANHDDDYASIVEHIQRILDQASADINPVKIQQMKFRGFLENFSLEKFAASKAASTHIRPILKTLFEKIFQRFAHFVNLKSGPYQPETYLTELRNNSDFRKFDDMVRMVLDCSSDVIEELQAYLEKERRAGRITYGVHLSDEALMTCLMLDLHHAQHIHFIDGADGGYAMAAKKLKTQMME
ncbi:hypothetical protein WH96_02170 [Kiloniella spongiae]|uniref:Adenylate cyclase n=1 Tax=Kiloniella spongiae TaxID=1489064 RepID=A0A0H2MIB8_9PROT|nr:DUF3095 domain-containing protein [Kiloniella spongiae]KLN62339.1 hypothetical protein WH96_02170 [Kiloniella spongiae]